MLLVNYKGEEENIPIECIRCFSISEKFEIPKPGRYSVWMQSAFNEGWFTVLESGEPIYPLLGGDDPTGMAKPGSLALSVKPGDRWPGGLHGMALALENWSYDPARDTGFAAEGKSCILVIFAKPESIAQYQCELESAGKKEC